VTCARAPQGKDLGRRDDLWSWLYILAELLEGAPGALGRVGGCHACGGSGGGGHGLAVRALKPSGRWKHAKACSAMAAMDGDMAVGAMVRAGGAFRAVEARESMQRHG